MRYKPSFRRRSQARANIPVRSQPSPFVLVVAKVFTRHQRVRYFVVLFNYRRTPATLRRALIVTRLVVVGSVVGLAQHRAGLRSHGRLRSGLRRNPRRGGRLAALLGLR